MTAVQPPLTYELAIANARRLLQAAEQETDRGLAKHFRKLAHLWFNIADLISCREAGES